MNQLCDKYDPNNLGYIRLWFGPFMPWIIVHDAKISNVNILNNAKECGLYSGKSRLI